MSTKQIDEAQIDQMIGTFYDQFDNRAGKTVDGLKIASMFHEFAQICKSTDSISETYDVNSFIKPRQILLNSDKFKNFHEFETSAKTRVFGCIAQRWSIYAKSWIQEGINSSGRGIKSFHLIRSDDNWKISNLIWTDETTKLKLPDRL